MPVKEKGQWGPERCPVRDFLYQSFLTVPFLETKPLLVKTWHIFVVQNLFPKPTTRQSSLRPEPVLGAINFSKMHPYTDEHYITLIYTIFMASVTPKRFLRHMHLTQGPFHSPNFSEPKQFILSTVP